MSNKRSDYDPVKAVLYTVLQEAADPERYVHSLYGLREKYIAFMFRGQVVTCTSVNAE